MVLGIKSESPLIKPLDTLLSSMLYCHLEMASNAAFGTKVLRRRITLFGIDKPVSLVLKAGGLSMSVAGARQKIFGSWEHVAHHLLTPADVPSYLAGRPMALLKKQAARDSKTTKRLEEKT